MSNITRDEAIKIEKDYAKRIEEITILASPLTLSRELAAANIDRFVALGMLELSEETTP